MLRGPVACAAGWRGLRQPHSHGEWTTSYQCRGFNENTPPHGRGVYVALRVWWLCHPDLSLGCVEKVHIELFRAGDRLEVDKR